MIDLIKKLVVLWTKNEKSERKELIFYNEKNEKIARLIIIKPKIRLEQV